MTAMYVIDQLVKEFNKAPEDRNEDVVNMDWYVLPLLNPDGKHSLELEHILTQTSNNCMQ